MTSIIDEMETLMRKETGAPVAPEATAEPAIADFTDKPKIRSGKGFITYSKLIEKVKKITGWKAKLYDAKKHGPDFLIPLPEGGLGKRWLKFIPELGEVKDILPDPQRMYEITLAYADNKTARLVGPPGVGKTNGELKLLTHVIGVPLYILRFNADLDRGYLVGEKELDNDDGTPVTNFVPTEATEFLLDCDVGVFVMDEVFKSNAGTLMVYQSLVEPIQAGSKPRTISVHGMEEPIQKVKTGIRIMATDNTKGLGDGLAQFAAANVADVSFLSRFDAVIEFTFLSRAHQLLLAKRWSAGRMSDHLCEQLVQFGMKMEDAYMEHKVGLSWSMRNLWEVVDLSIKFEDPVRAIAVNYFRGLAKKEQRELVDKIRENVFGGKYGNLGK